MKIYKVGDTQQAICDRCASLETATFQLRDVPFSDGSGVVKSVLVGVCDRCDGVCILPHQSTPAVRAQLERQRKPVESRLPAHFLDILNLAVEELGGTPDFGPSLVKYYIHRLTSDQAAIREMEILLQTELAKGKADKRLSIKGRQVADDLKKLQDVTGLTNKTDLIKGAILLIHEEVLQAKKPDAIAQLKNALAAVA